GIEVDTEVFLVIHDDETFSFELARGLTGEPLADALALTGVPATADPAAARRSLAQAVGLPASAKIDKIIEAYDQRRDPDIADRLRQAAALPASA
ncbi:MAG: hypothetical protein LBT54_07635, partial [Bifidobacteriaceae bacterium]|nr:hypothetical protein [Bifidobacteriaceae bacterium]